MEEKIESNITDSNESSNIIKIQIEDEMKQSYLDYAMSVIVGRALPDVKDGLKPVHRRILYAMHDMGMFHNKAYKKSARIVGEVLGKYHPHGDTAVYDTMVRMAQEFSLRYMLIDGQGNFGSVDGDRAAAMRYTEARMTKMAEDILKDIDKDTVDFRPNFDESLKEPIVMPSKFPNLLANGSVGIAVGMATNIPPHNVRELCQGVIRLIDNPESQISDLMEDVQGPDFPTGGIIYGKYGIHQAYKTGRGSIKVRGKTHIEEKNNRTKIIIDEIPYQVNKASMIEQIAHCVRDKVITGISDIRDESDKDGMRVVIELKRDGVTQIILNQLFKHTRLQQSFGIINLALVDAVPKVLDLKTILEKHIEHRVDVVSRRTQFELTKAQKRAHILLGLKKAIDNIDRAITIIRESSQPSIAREGLMSAFELDEIQSQAILDMKLQKLTGLEREKIMNEYKELLVVIADLKDILDKKDRVMQIIKEETQEIVDSYQDSRRTEIVEGEEEIEMEDLIEGEDIVITISRGGYCKRVGLDTYKAQRRGGRGIRGASTKEDDIVEDIFTTHNKSYVLCFSNLGKVYWLKGYKIPEASRTASGKHIANILPLVKDETITTFVPIKEFTDGYNLIMATKKGTVKKSSVMDYSRPRNGGIKGIVLDEDDQLINALMVEGDENIMLATKNGMAVRFKESDVRKMGRVSRGVRGIRLAAGDEVIGMILAHDDKTILTVTKNGYGKRTPVDDYRLINRGGKGVTNIKTTDRNGEVVAIKEVDDENGVVLISKKGIIIRTRAEQIGVIGRNTQGVRLMKLDSEDAVAGVSKIPQSEDDDSEDEEDSPSDGPDAPNEPVVKSEEAVVEEKVEETPVAEEVEEVTESISEEVTPEPEPVVQEAEPVQETPIISEPEVAEEPQVQESVTDAAIEAIREAPVEEPVEEVVIETPVETPVQVEEPKAESTETAIESRETVIETSTEEPKEEPAEEKEEKNTDQNAFYSEYN